MTRRKIGLSEMGGTPVKSLPDTLCWSENLVAHFPHPLQGELFRNGQTILLTAPFVFQDGDLTVEVPDGFSSDYNSVPRGLWNIFPPWMYPEAGVVHDFLYRYNGVTRAEADRIHRRILELGGCSWIKRQAAYLALRAAGWVPWGRYRRAETSS